MAISQIKASPVSGVSSPIIKAAKSITNYVARTIGESATDKLNLSDHYFSGLQGLSKAQRATWEQQYLEDIQGMDEAEKDNFFRNQLFTDVFSNSEDEEDKKIWENRASLTRKQRDALFAQKAIISDIDGKSDSKEASIDALKFLKDSNYAADITEAKLSGPTLREAATEYLNKKSRSKAREYQEALNEAPKEEVEGMLGTLYQVANNISPYFKKYIGTDKLDPTIEDDKNLLAQFSAWEDVGGSAFAARMLGIHYQDVVASNQNLLEKTLNTGAQFVDSGAGMLIRAAGMAAGLTSLVGDEGESYWNNIIDNPITRYGDRVATTQSWKVAEQKELEEMGLSDNPILNTWAQQNKIISGNTLFEVLGQYGFTAASTILSFGGAWGVKGAGALGRAATASKIAKGGSEATKLAKNLIRAEDLGNILVTGGIGTVEGGMNAAQTKSKYVKEQNLELDNRINALIDRDIDNYVATDLVSAMQTVANFGINPAELSGADNIAAVLKGIPQVRAQFKVPYQEREAIEKQAIEETAEAAMYRDFIITSAINGFIQSTLKASLNAPSVQKSLRKAGLAKSPLDQKGVKLITRSGSGNVLDRTKAVAKKYTKGELFREGLKTSLGQGLEEYEQELSSAYGTGFAEDKLQQYLDYKYGESKESDAFEFSLIDAIRSGLSSVGDTMLSPESIKSGIYGALSTLIGGVNIKTNRTGKSNFNKIPVTWQTPLSALWNKSEVDEINAKREKAAQDLNSFFTDPTVANLFFGLDEQINWMAEVRDAAESGDEKRLRDAKVGEMVSIINTINALQDNAFSKAITTSLNERAKFNADNLSDENSAESKAVAQYKAEVANRGENISDEEALDSIVSTSKNILQLMDDAKKESREVEKLFGADVDEDLKDALVYQRLTIKDSEKRMEQLDKELELVSQYLDRQKTATSNTVLSDASKVTIARYGSIAALEKALASKTKELKVTQTLHQSLKDLLEVTKDKDKVNIIFGEIVGVSAKETALKQEVSALTDSLDKVNEEIGDKPNRKSQVLSARDIMELDAISRASMLDTSNRGRYSQRQLTEIDKVLTAGTRILTGFKNKVSDRSRLETSVKNAESNQLALVTNPARYRGYLNFIKKEKRLSMLGKKYEYLTQYNDYASFAEEMSRISQLDNPEEYQAAKRVLEVSDSPYWNTYKQNKKELDNAKAVITKLPDFTSLSKNDRNITLKALEYLTNRGVNINNSSEVIEALSAMHGEKSFFEEYIDEYNKDVTQDKQLTLPKTEEIINTVNTLISKYNKEVTKASEQAQPINIENAPTGSSSAEKEIAPKVTQGVLPEASAQETLAQEDLAGEDVVLTSEKLIDDALDSLDSLFKAEVEKKIIVGSATSTIPASQRTQDIVKEQLATIKSLRDNYTSIEDIVTALVEAADTMPNLNNRDVRQAAIILKSIAQNLVKPSARTPKQDIFSMVASTTTSHKPIVPTAKGIETMDIEDLKTSPRAKLFQVLIDFYDKHNIGRYLKEGKLKKGDTVYYMSDPDLFKAVSDSMGDKFTKYDKPLIIVKEDPEGTIIVSEERPDGKGGTTKVDVHYQPVGIMPATFEEEEAGKQKVGSIGNLAVFLGKAGKFPKNGNARLGKVRDRIDEENLGAILTDSQGQKLASEVLAVNATNMTSTEDRGVIDLAIASLTDTEKTEYAATPDEKKKGSNIFKRLRESFISKLTVEEIPNREGTSKVIRYNPPLKSSKSTNAITVFRKDISQSRHVTTGKTLVDTFKEGSDASILQFNSRINRAGRLFFDTLSADSAVIKNMSEIEFNPDGTIVASEDLSASLEEFGKDFTRKFNDFIYIPNYEFKLAVNQEGNFVLTLESTTSNLSIVVLDNITREGITDKRIVEALRNILIDNDKIKTYNGNEPYWQIPYADISQLKTNEAAKKNIEDIFDDDILYVRENSLFYTPKGVVVKDPYDNRKVTDTTPPTPVVTTNPDNAATANAGPIGITSTPNGSVDIDTGEGAASKPGSMPENPIDSPTAALQNWLNSIQLSEQAVYRRLFDEALNILGVTLDDISSDQFEFVKNFVENQAVIAGRDNEEFIKDYAYSEDKKSPLALTPVTAESGDQQNNFSFTSAQPSVPSSQRFYINKKAQIEHFTTPEEYKKKGHKPNTDVVIIGQNATELNVVILNPKAIILGKTLPSKSAMAKGASRTQVDGWNWNASVDDIANMMGKTDDAAPSKDESQGLDLNAYTPIDTDTTPNLYVEPKYRWENFSKDTADSVKGQDIDEEQWLTMANDQRDHALGCANSEIEP